MLALQKPAVLIRQMPWQKTSALHATNKQKSLFGEDKEKRFVHCRGSVNAIPHQVSQEPLQLWQDVFGAAVKEAFLVHPSHTKDENHLFIWRDNVYKTGE